MVLVLWALFHQLFQVPMVDMVEAMAMVVTIVMVEITIGRDREMMIATAHKSPQKEHWIMNLVGTLIMSLDRKKIHGFERVVIRMMTRKMIGNDGLNQNFMG
ncbi:hypothetical protein Lalb_Chr14g0367121 [Lupinus albus]|uniref:Uncharacterized protein n=1 Tax=Lupinus albus TaxID=3870 RepID=A0A6A4PF44_LUPAL|nr:hypothetical protein Lalb_Chr14g0367121 [Lupinus albus]